MDEVQSKRESVLITKRGKPLAKLVPVEKNPEDIFNSMKGKGSIVGDVGLSRVQPGRMGKSVLILLDPHIVLWVPF
jgi:antitoxin (DNA-binding transcriptional repressor) of toxin-antitoxin stability system